MFLSAACTATSLPTPPTWERAACTQADGSEHASVSCAASRPAFFESPLQQASDSLLEMRGGRRADGGSQGRHHAVAPQRPVQGAHGEWDGPWDAPGPSVAAARPGAPPGPSASWLPAQSAHCCDRRLSAVLLTRLSARSSCIAPCSALSALVTTYMPDLCGVRSRVEFGSSTFNS